MARTEELLSLIPACHQMKQKDYQVQGIGTLCYVQEPSPSAAFLLSSPRRDYLKRAMRIHLPLLVF